MNLFGKITSGLAVAALAGLPGLGDVRPVGCSPAACLLGRVKHGTGWFLATLMAIAMCGGCGGSSHPAVSASTTSSPSTTAPASTAMCTTATLRVVGGDEQGAVGNWAIPILFVNDGQAACHLYGYPGVSWITATGSQIGPAAVRETSVSPQLVTLQPEQAAVAVVLQPSRANQVASGCAVTQAAAITVYPPGNTAAATVTTGGRNWAAGLNWCSNGKAEATVDPVSVFQGRIPAAAPSCQPGQLSFALARDLGSLMQQPAAYFRFTSRSAQACSLYGYPGFELVDSSGQVISLRVRHGLSYQILDPGPQLVTLPPGATAYFGFGWADVNQPAGTSAGCVTAVAARAMPPGTYQQLGAVSHLSSLVCAKMGGELTAVAPGPAFTPSTP